MHRFEFAVPLGVRALAEVRCRLADWLERNGLADPARANLVLATHESIANAIEHAHATKPVLVSAERRDAHVVVAIADDGRWQTQAQPSPDRGLGIALMRKLVTRVEIATGTTGTTIRLLQHLPGAEPDAGTTLESPQRPGLQTSETVDAELMKSEPGADKERCSPPA
jgi:anti-sigma regulatory factor (Ser/Thr protein kinase)